MQATAREHEGGGGSTKRGEPASDAVWNSAILASLFDRMRDAIVVADVRGRFVAVNAAARRISKTYDPSNPEGWSEHFDVYRADGETRADPQDLPLATATRGQTAGEMVIRLRPRHPEAGTEDIWLSASGYPLLDADGRCLGGAVVLRDIKAPPEQARRARRAETELHGHVRVLDAIIRGMGDGVVHVRDRARHLVDIGRTREFGTDGTVEHQVVGLQRIINDAVRVIRESVDRRGGTIEVDCSRAPTEILVHQPSRFRKMVLDLLENAMEATDERAARLENDAGWRPAIRVLAYRAERTGFLVIDIIDNGIGIDPSRLRSVLNAGYTTRKDGRGPGLHSAANFVVGSGGSVQPLSAGTGHGTTMRVTWRLAAQLATLSSRSGS